MHVRGWQADESACGFYRMQQPFRALDELDGVRAEAQLVWSGPELVDSDIAVIQRASERAAVGFLLEVQRRGTPVVYEVDDDLLHLDPRNPLFNHYQVRSRRLAVAAGIEAANAVTCSTEPLAAELRKLNPRVYVLPNSLPEYWQQLSELAELNGQDDSLVRVVWAGSLTHGQDFHGNAARYGVTRLAREGGIEFHMIGYDYGPRLGVETTFHPWRPSIESFHRYLVGLDAQIGLCPLARTKFNASKSGLKAMEYQAAGIVPVATRCEAYDDVIEHGETGFLCTSEMQWKDALHTLATDHELRRKMAANCLALTKGRLYSSRAELWLAAYASILDD